MLVKIKAILSRTESSPDRDYFINPDYIQNASFKETPLSLELTMSDGTVFSIFHSCWIRDAGKESQVIKLLYDEFLRLDQEMSDKEYDQWVDQQAKKYYQSIGYYSEDW